jgi:hypothetical protein
VRSDVLGVRSDTLSCNSLMPRIVKTAYPTVVLGYESIINVSMYRVPVPTLNDIFV